MASTGFVDILAYLFTVLILKFVGRKCSSFALFAFSGICLLSLLAIPQGKCKSKCQIQIQNKLKNQQILSIRRRNVDSDASDVR